MVSHGLRARANSLLKKARKAKAANANATNVNRLDKVQDVPFTPQAFAPRSELSSSVPSSDETEEATQAKSDKQHQAEVRKWEAELDEYDREDEVREWEAELDEYDREDEVKKASIRDMKARQRAKSAKAWRHFFRRRRQNNLI
jgi:hypothetical protein